MRMRAALLLDAIARTCGRYADRLHPPRHRPNPSSPPAPLPVDELTARRADRARDDCLAALHDEAIARATHPSAWHPRRRGWTANRGDPTP